MAGTPSPPRPQKLLVIDEPAVAERIRDLWQTRGEGSLEIVHAEWTEVQGAGGAWSGVDAVLFPVDLLGDLVVGRHIVVFPARVLDDPALEWRRVWEAVRRRTVVWDRQVVAVPLAVGVPVLWYRGDLWEEQGWQPPLTWSQLAHQLQQLRQAHGESLGRVMEPLAEGWAARSFLARAAAYAQHPSFFSVLFHPDTMDALIDSPPFHRALQELVEVSVADSFTLGPQETLVAAAQQQAAVAIGVWPKPESLGQVDLRSWRVALLPGAAQCYDRRAARWQERAVGAERVTLLGYDGMLGAVTTRAGNERAAGNLLAWITGPEWSGSIAAAGQRGLPPRDSAAAHTDVFSADTSPIHLREAYVQVVQQALGNPRVLAIPVIGGQRQYMAALDAAVRRALRREESVEDALRQVSHEWNALTDQLGRREQLDAYRKSLGL